MPKRLRDDEMDAAVQADHHPSSDAHPEDADWHRAQNTWLRSWQSDVELPAPKEKSRRTEWDKLTKMHARAVAAAAKRDKLREAQEAAAAREAVEQEAAEATAAQEMTTHQVPAPQATVQRAATRQTATDKTACREAVAVQAAKKVTEVQAAAAAEDREVETPAWSPPLTLSATPVAYVQFSQDDGRDVQGSDGQVIRAHVHNGIHHWNVWGVMCLWPPPCGRYSGTQCGPHCMPCDRSPCDDREPDRPKNGYRWGPADAIPSVNLKARWLAQAPEVEQPSACALFGCSGCRNFPVRGFRMMPRPRPWEPNQTPWFTESYSAQMRAKDAVAVTVQRVHEYSPGMPRQY